MAQEPHNGRQAHEAAHAPPPAAPAKSEKELAAEKQAFAAASIGGQVILDFNGDASLGARGGAAGDMVSNVLARDAALAAMGFDPAAPSGPPPSKEMMEAKKKADEAKAKAAEDGPAAPGKATKASSLA